MDMYFWVFSSRKCEKKKRKKKCRTDLGYCLKQCHDTMEQKIADFGRFFGEKSDFDGAKKDFGMEKSGVKKSEKNRRFFL